jgi:hypothetical protein
VWRSIWKRQKPRYGGTQSWIDSVSGASMVRSVTSIHRPNDRYSKAYPYFAPVGNSPRWSGPQRNLNAPCPISYAARQLCVVGEKAPRSGQLPDIRRQPTRRDGVARPSDGPACASRGTRASRLARAGLGAPCQRVSTKCRSCQFCRDESDMKNGMSSSSVSSGRSCWTQWPAPAIRCAPCKFVHAVACMASKLPGTW